ncbi:CesT family type III secretion system chaperone [Achromobacter sp. Bel]|uniref:CesT family type III secretion system chaperone n=1 Tax=Achromobacter sp. Bel TaxID=2727415 RepID=UPI00145D9B2B|nr:CesT family type III secretion system chaperone [Achromobacter sp. Bel]NMK50024.1 type III secretion system chaperone [Achromobacter sp. Bel]
MNSSPHALIADYAGRHGLPAPASAAGRMTIVIDEVYRVHLQPAPQGWLAMTARLCALPAAGAGRDALVREVGRLSAGMLSRHKAACVVDPQGRALWLQQTLAPDGGAQSLDEAVGEFANALSFWAGAVRRLA